MHVLVARNHRSIIIGLSFFLKCIRFLLYSTKNLGESENSAASREEKLSLSPNRHRDMDRVSKGTDVFWWRANVFGARSNL